MLSSRGLFPSYETELIPLLPYLRAGLSKGRGGGGGNVGIAPGNRPPNQIWCVGVTGLQGVAYFKVTLKS